MIERQVLPREKLRATRPAAMHLELTWNATAFPPPRTDHANERRNGCRCRAA